MDYVAALGLVFFTSLPLVAAVHFLRLALKRETTGTSRVVCLVFGLLALVFTFWVSFQKGEWVCADAVALLLKRFILLVLLLPSAYFIEKAYGQVWTNSQQYGALAKVLGKSVVTFLVAVAVGLGCYVLWFKFIA